MSNFLSSREILSNEAEGISALYNLEHAQNTLFFASFLGGSDHPEKYRISKISITSPTLNFDKTNNRFLYLKEAKLPDEIQITWIEDANRSVERLHLDWARRWYDFGADYIPIGNNGKFKNIRIDAYHYINNNTTIAAPIMDAEPTVSITLNNCVPTNIGPNFAFDWGNGGIKEFTTAYKFSKLSIEYNEVTAMSDSKLSTADRNVGGGYAYKNANGEIDNTHIENAWTGTPVGRPYTMMAEVPDLTKISSKVSEEQKAAEIKSTNGTTNDAGEKIPSNSSSSTGGSSEKSE